MGGSILLVYIDITDSNALGILFLTSFLQSHFHSKDLGVLKYFLGIEEMRSKKDIFSKENMCLISYLR